MITIQPLDLLLFILALMAIPIGVLVSMILWRVYRMLDRIERLLDFGIKITNLLANLEKIPMMLLSKIFDK